MATATRKSYRETTALGKWPLSKADEGEICMAKLNKFQKNEIRMEVGGWLAMKKGNLPKIDLY